ncbi:MAG: gluconate 2-dehydrogenase subunit 3 family protein [Flavobacteriaceae bacterium]|nr:gluconate 2-dehydrogenase subunit 3 family protein [Flavobacteriaceae bacterium]MBL6684300.1 gluconate 2-dehydrogenase subunit 3 family protein [Flavobacteriaceae bacterium]
MNRRDSIKNLTFLSIGAGLLLEGCYGISREKIKRSLTRYEYGRTPEEKLYDDKLFAEKFFTNQELFTLDKICNLILPPNEFGSIRDAEVVQLIEFMAKDIPTYKEPLRNGLIWIDNESKKRFNNLFVDCEIAQQVNIFDEIAYYDPNKSITDYSEPIQWFNLLRNLTMTGYFTSEVGINELGYKGNIPNIWDGVPQDVLDQYGLEYDKDWLEKFVDQSKRNIIAEWDDDGNLLT